ncbi:histidine decarboxylase [Galendromus occidentalis]|uniref:Histidine decarboxylase n=1 Tax=Galendromus occidentalis TaxID=34638 RepID=A0AAJ7WGZ4_9ACAR|nr:histidine decarboxylase [Galendromus occidentalis]
MDLNEYRKRAKEMVDIIADYLETVGERRVFPDVKPGYMLDLVPEDAPTSADEWDSVIHDIYNVIIPGLTHWQSPHMHAYFPALNCPASLLGDMLADGLNCLGFTWASSPAVTELEVIVMDWLAKMLGLPKCFLHSNETGGGGVIQTTASEATLCSLLAARSEMLRKERSRSKLATEDWQIMGKLVAYCSDQAHSSVEKAGLIGQSLVKISYVECDDEYSMRGSVLQEMIERDRQAGLIPFFVCATLGTTGSCSFDDLEVIGHICRENDLWLHVDAAYAGTAFICPEYREWLRGVEFANTFAFNPSKWMMVHFDCCAMWVQDSRALHRTFNVDPLYLQHENTGLAVDYMHWQIPLSRRFRSLKLWFVIRLHGVSGLQTHVRRGVHLAKYFEDLVSVDQRFEIPAKRHLGMVVFRLRGANILTEMLLKKLNSSGRIHCVPASLRGIYVIRFTVTSARTSEEDIHNDWKLIKATADTVLAGSRPRIKLADIKEQAPEFGSSLLLVNTPMTPKVIDGSFAALFEQLSPGVQNAVQKWFGNAKKQTAAMDRLEVSRSPRSPRSTKAILEERDERN